ncbi:anti-sigma factor family protein [Fuerstiella marisgermanici]|uniref:Putative transmembrane transcriptional regulator (Anti-sigma factor) n=1 Tax=Fuerstiella marisgermanici TaxID=1891926 RepID=A0A1P8WFA7_9PLAN|nr:hypothetical protein [Fuerstiella marisgermanici]APZ92720.1 putative transmembrane transcriptional regulator (anti-sigma factor) [Fuerstiella marisgermanici]
MSADRNEILIQRCVDNELSAAERRELMQQLDSCDEGWKELACAFMEDRMFANAIRDEPTATVVPPASLTPQKQKPHWFHHPMMSLILSASVAFLGGVLISQEMRPDAAGQVAGSGLASRNAAGQRSEPAGVDAAIVSRPSNNLESVTAAVSNRPHNVGSNRGSHKGYKAVVQPYGMPPQEMPVYDASEYATGSADFWQAVSRHDQARQNNSPTPRIRYLRLKGADGETYVFPVQETVLPVLMQ